MAVESTSLVTLGAVGAFEGEEGNPAGGWGHEKVSSRSSRPDIDGAFASNLGKRVTAGTMVKIGCCLLAAAGPSLAVCLTLGGGRLDGSRHQRRCKVSCRRMHCGWRLGLGWSQGGGSSGVGGTGTWSSVGRGVAPCGWATSRKCNFGRPPLAVLHLVRQREGRAFDRHESLRHDEPAAAQKYKIPTPPLLPAPPNFL